MSRRRLLLAAGVVAVAGTLPLAGLLAFGETGLLGALALLNLVVLALVLRVWLSLDGSVRDLDRKLRREVGAMRKRLSRDLDAAELSKYRTDAAEIVKQVKAERQAMDTRLLESERKAWELHRETLRQVDQGFHVQKDEISRRHALTARELDRMLHAEYSQLEALVGLYYELRPPTSFPATRSWVASPDLLRHLYQRVRDEMPKLVLECGSGLSTVMMAYGIREAKYNGKIVALEHLERYAESTRRMLDKHGLSEYAEVRMAPLRNVELEGESWPWYDLSQLPTDPIHLLFVDGPPGDTRPQARYPALPLLQDRLGPGATIVLDDHRRAEESAVAQRWLETIDGLGIEELRHEKGTAVLTYDGAAPTETSGDDGSSAQAPTGSAPRST